jgi:hypothetical protein
MNRTNTIFFEKASVSKHLNTLPENIEYLFIDILKIDDYFNLPILNLKEVRISVCKFSKNMKAVIQEHKYPYYSKKENLHIIKVPFGCKLEFAKPFYITDRYGEFATPKLRTYKNFINMNKNIIHINNTSYLDKFLSKEFYKHYPMYVRYQKGHIVQYSKYGLYYLDHLPYDYNSEQQL